MKKFLIAAALASLALFSLAACGGKDASSAAEPKDYSQIIHDARTDEENENLMILTGKGDGSFTAADGPAGEMTEEDLKAQADNFILPMLGLQDGDYEEFSASVSLLNVRSYGVAIVKPAEGKTETVQEALENYVTSQQMSMENYLADQYEIAKAATVTTVPTGPGRLSRLPYKITPPAGFPACGLFFGLQVCYNSCVVIFPIPRSGYESDCHHPQYQRQGLAEGLHRVGLCPDRAGL